MIIRFEYQIFTDRAIGVGYIDGEGKTFEECNKVAGNNLERLYSDQVIKNYSLEVRNYIQR